VVLLLAKIRQGLILMLEMEEVGEVEDGVEEGLEVMEMLNRQPPKRHWKPTGREIYPFLLLILTTMFSRGKKTNSNSLVVVVEVGGAYLVEGDLEAAEEGAGEEE
jgi:hypothetical protein